MRDEIEKMNPNGKRAGARLPVRQHVPFRFFVCEVGGRECGRTDVAGRVKVSTVNREREIAQHSARRERERFVGLGTFNCEKENENCDFGFGMSRHQV